MQHHIGTDIIEIDRVKHVLDCYGERFLNRVFTQDELEIYGRLPHALAASFASKEAVMKVLGTGNRGVAWREIETLNHSTGKPFIRLNGRAKKVADELGLTEIEVSLSHSKEYAIAVAIGST
jgi:holo-[acyl-carrier-protein] synthase